MSSSYTRKLALTQMSVSTARIKRIQSNFIIFARTCVQCSFFLGRVPTSCTEKIHTLTRARYSSDDDNYEVDDNGDVEIPMPFNWRYSQSHAYII